MTLAISTLSLLSLLALYVFSLASASPVAAGAKQNVIPLCNKFQCPPLDCEDTVLPEGECCPICIRPDILPEHKQCMHDGETIEHDETFFPALSTTGNQNLNLSANSACNECTCFDGVISCKDLSKECPSLQCHGNDPVVVEDTCCPVCPDSAPTEPPQGAGCSVDGQWYPNGASWHPSYPGLGLITCINCTCTDSQTQCHRLPCPAESSLPPCTPEDPIEDITLCCPKCRHVPLTDATTTMATPTATPTSSTMVPPSLAPCNTTHTVRVWRHASEDAVAAEMTEVGMVRSYRWSRVNGEYRKEVRDLSSAEFMRQGYHFKGWAKQSRLNGLTTRAKKAQRIDDCSSDCASLIIRLLRVESSCPA